MALVGANLRSAGDKQIDDLITDTSGLAEKSELPKYSTALPEDVLLCKHAVECAFAVFLRQLVASHREGEKGLRAVLCHVAKLVPSLDPQRRLLPSRCQRQRRALRGALSAASHVGQHRQRLRHVEKGGGNEQVRCRHVGLRKRGRFPEELCVVALDGVGAGVDALVLQLQVDVRGLARERVCHVLDRAGQAFPGVEQQLIVQPKPDPVVVALDSDRERVQNGAYLVSKLEAGRDGQEVEGHMSILRTETELVGAPVRIDQKDIERILSSCSDDVRKHAVGRSSN
eukprot:2623381-Rhodomonas_salina.1